MRSPALVYALLVDEQRATLNRGHAARQGSREVARTERRLRRAATPRPSAAFRYRPERGSASCLP